ncbi:DUF3090 domain-containing protein [Paenarthrobacter nicotinovorans]|uniref:DUF3090 domain-containing protein n=1 Tax=Paenarthrobacter nicotinovorans TaxID=29320 RepID=UPI003827265F
MPTRVHEFAWPDRVVIGTIGLPGARTFYLQVRAGTQIVSVAVEKQQSAQLAEKIDELLDQLSTVKDNPFSVPSSSPVELDDNEPLESPVEQFRAGAMSLGWDPTTAQVVIEAYPIDADVDDLDEPLERNGPEDTEMLLVRMPVGTARAFTKRTHEIVAAGRPSCAFCGYPMDPEGHTCTLPEV